jgi:hypothetical protein
MKQLFAILLAICLLASPIKGRCQSTEELDVHLKELTPTSVRLTWTSLAPARCGETVTYSVYRGESEDFDPAPDNQIAEGLIAPTFISREPKSRKGWYYRVLATRTQGYCAPPALDSGVIVAAPLDLGREYRVSVGEKSEPCHASSTAELECPSLPSFHAVIAGQLGHEFLIGCLASDYEYDNWTCVNLSPGVYRVTVHSMTVTVWDAGFRKINSSSAKELGSITPVFSLLGVLH